MQSFPPKIGGLLLLQILFLLLFAQTAQAESPDLPLHVNVGGDSYDATDGTRYLGDQEWHANGSYGYVGGTARQVGRTAPIFGSDDRPLLDQQQVGWQEYRVGPLPSGAYVVTLTFLERRVHGPEQAIFNLLIEEAVALSGLDLFAVAGLDSPHTRRFLTHVDDGELTLGAHAVSGSYGLAALSVHAVDWSAPTPAAPEDITGLPSFDATILSWRKSAESQLLGYLIHRRAAGEQDFQRITTEPQLTDHFADAFVELLADPDAAIDPSTVDWEYRITALDVYGRESEPSATMTVRPLDPHASELPVYEMEISAENQAQLQADIWTYDEVPATVTVDGREYDAEVRFRGHAGRTYPKKSWKVIFRGDSPIAPRDRMNLRSQYEDASLLRGQLTTEVYEEMGIQPPLSRQVLLFINGEYAGLYNDFEQVDEQFLARTGRDVDASIYGTSWTTLGNWGDLLETPEQYRTAYNKETNTGSGYADLIKFVEALNYTENDDMAAWLARNLDIQQFLDYYVSVVLTQNMDFTRHNVFLIQNHELDRWEIIPWDPDYTWGAVNAFSRNMAHNLPIDLGTDASPDAFNGPNRLLTRVLDAPQYRSYYCGRLQMANETLLDAAQVDAIVDTAYAEIETAGKADWQKYGWHENEWFEAGPARIKAWAEQRRNHIDGDIERYCQEERIFLTINEAMPANESILCDPDEEEIGDVGEDADSTCYDPWIEIYNAGLESVTLQGLYLSNDPNEPALSRIDAPISVPPLGHVLLWLDGEKKQGPNHTSFRLSAEDTTITLTARDGTTTIDRMELASPPPDRSWGRFPDGAANQTMLTLTSPGSRNRSAPAIELSVENVPPITAGEVIEIVASIADDGEVTAADLYYETGDGVWHHLSMVREHFGRYHVSIPGQPAGTLLAYHVTAVDDEGLVARVPSADPNDYFVLDVGIRTASVRISRFHVDAPQNKDEAATGWIELHNYGNKSASLGDLYLSNDESNPTKHALPADIILDDGERLIFLADGDVEAGITHLNFSLDFEGGLVALNQSDEEGTRLLDSHRYGNQAVDPLPNGCQGETTTWITSVSLDPDEPPLAVCFNTFLPLVSRRP